MCDRILVIDHGKIVADGTPAELSERVEGAEQLSMTIEGEPDAVLGVLRAIPGVSEAVATVEDGMKSIYRITAEPGADIRRAMFDALSQHRLAILSMQQVELSLEDIFLELTGAEPAPEEAPAPADEAPKKKRRLFGRKRGEDK